jgi:hypothetical protein
LDLQSIAGSEAGEVVHESDKASFWLLCQEFGVLAGGMPTNPELSGPFDTISAYLISGVVLIDDASIGL